jgi:hypothetical protein
MHVRVWERKLVLVCLQGSEEHVRTSYRICVYVMHVRVLGAQTQLRAHVSAGYRICMYVMHVRVGAHVSAGYRICVFTRLRGAC